MIGELFADTVVICLYEKLFMSCPSCGKRHEEKVLTIKYYSYSNL